jgi:uncharacterized membrane protein HdeD (DUF308 family)
MTWTSFFGAHQPLAPPAKWGWFMFLGILLIVLGAIAWMDTIAVTFASTIVIGLMMLISGLFQIVHAFMIKQWRGLFLGLLLGALYVIGGVFIIQEPVRGAVVLTLFLAIMVIIGGIVRIVLALQHREIRSWGLLLLSGVVSLIVGILIYSTLPWSGLWVLGTLVAVELIMQGLGWLFFGFALKNLHDSESFSSAAGAAG